MLDRPLSVRTRGGSRGARSTGGKVRRRGSRRWRFLPSARTRRRWWRIFRRRSAVTKWILVLGVLAIACVAVNWIYQVVRKPSELFFPVSGTLYKTPAETWQQYAPLFKQYSTGVMTPELLAAIAQVEGSGNPVARTYWRWSWTRQPFEMYRPASSAVGMYQLTDGTFAEARRFCIRHHTVVEDGPWNDWRSCWFNSLYARVVPSDAVELTAAYLDRSVATVLERHHVSAATLAHKQELATLIHLCGAGAGDEFATRGFRLFDGQRCGDHEARVYLARVGAMKEEFARLAARASSAGGY
jgi:hypothetical protein